MPSSFKDLMVALIRLSCGSFWNSSAHSTIRAFSFSHTLGWAYRWQATKQLWSLPSCVFMIEEDWLPNNKALTHLRAKLFEEHVMILSAIFKSTSERVHLCENDTSQEWTKRWQTDVVTSMNSKRKKARQVYLPCSAHSVLHWQTPLNRFPSGIFCHSLTHMHQATARERKSN